MKTCKIYSTIKNTETNAVIIDRCVLLPASQRSDIDPAYVDGDGQCYYPPLIVVDFAEGMPFDLVPFSTECAWGEFGEEDSPTHNWVSSYSCDDYPVKWGYCDAKTGDIRIAPEFERCQDFNKYGAAIVSFYELYAIVDTKGEIIGDLWEYIVFEIKQSHHGIFFVDQTCEGWGALDSEGDILVEPGYAEIDWDGIGGFTIKNHQRDTYGIRNGNAYGCIVNELTAKPVSYDFPPEYRRGDLPWDQNCYGERFRLIQKGDKYGLIRDYIEKPDDPWHTASELILDPEFSYEEIPEAAYREWTEQEIRYYAEVMFKTPRKLPGRVGDGWGDVPKNIRAAVRGEMLKNGWEQPETADDIGG